MIDTPHGRLTEPRVELRFGARSDRGMVRPNNEDSYITAPPCFVVADGMGGHARGQAASQAAVENFLSLTGHKWATGEEVLAAIDSASAAVSRLSGEGRPPGSTLAGVVLTLQANQPRWLVFNIGDSRVYLLRKGELTQISEDHSVLWERPGEGSRNVITRALGAGMVKPLVADQWLLSIHKGDQILICSDGLYSEVTEFLMTALLLGDADPRDKAAALVEAAKRAGGRDNVTAVVVVVDTVDADGVDSDPDEETIPGNDDTVQDLEMP